MTDRNRILWLRLALLSSVLAALCVPKVFTSSVNALAYTANWISYQLDWDWHSISSSWSPDANILTRPRPKTHPSVWLVLTLATINFSVLIATPFAWRKVSPAVRLALRLLIEANVVIVGFLLIALWIRLHVNY